MSELSPRPTLDSHGHNHGHDLNINGHNHDLEKMEETHRPYEGCHFEENGVNRDFFIIRCVTLFCCLVGIILVFVNLCRGNRLKSWRLYILVATSVFVWIALTLYESVDTICSGFLIRDASTFSIYYCFLNFLHGFSIYCTILLLAHLSDMQHRCQWFVFIAAAIFVPLTYSVGLLIFDMRVRILLDWKPDYKRQIAIDSIRFFLYNVLSNIILFFMSCSFLTNRLYGTYSEKRSKVVVLLARWTYVFLLIHNLVALPTFILKIIVKPDLQFDLDLVKKLDTAQAILSEIEFITMVLSVPMSYLIGSMAQCCCGVARGNDMEMDKVDKIYNDVWTTPSARNPSSVVNSSRPPSATPSSIINSRPASATPRANTTSTSGGGPVSGLQNGVVSRRNHGSNSTLSSVDSIGELPRIATNPGGGGNERRKRVRESYMEAVSTGSLNDDRSSMTSDPIDL